MSLVCVYCASSNRVDPVYFTLAEAMGQQLAARGHRLIYGGGNVGLMGVLARSVHAAGGHVTGVIPEALKAIEGVAYDVADELIVTRTMQERKAIMFTRAEAFLVLPGGFGTLEELMEVLTLKQLGYHVRPILLVNAGGFFDPLLALFDHFIRTGFAQEAHRTLFQAVPTPAAALEALELLLVAPARPLAAIDKVAPGL
jgi:hypothetical protein